MPDPLGLNQLASLFGYDFAVTGDANELISDAQKVIDLLEE